MIIFPQNFLWGTAASAYQLEGGNNNCDWWLWEQESRQKDVSGGACRHYEFYKQDFDLAKSLNHNAHRLSIEWSRIEPKEGEFSLSEISHYKDVIIALKERNIEPVVTLHHFTNPLWFARLGGWLNKKSYFYFLRYVRNIVEALGDNVHYWITINEPSVYIYYSYILGAWPPQQKSIPMAIHIQNNMAVSHIKAYRLIHDIYKNKGRALPSVSIAMNMQAFVSCRPTLMNKFAVYLRDKIYNRSFIDGIIRHNAIDFISLNYYSRTVVDVKKWGIKNLFFDTCTQNHHSLKQNDMGWDIYPQGLSELLISLKKYNLPVFITENGICTNDDALRWEFIREHLKSVSHAIDAGVNIMGYLYWSLLDNFEWDKGFGPRFGLIEVDYNTYKRTIRKSAEKFASVCKSGMLDPES